jgi:hypothetical protein
LTNAYHIYEHQRAALDDNHLEKYASELELDLTLFNHDMSSHAHTQPIREDFLSGVNGMPTFCGYGL